MLYDDILSLNTAPLVRAHCAGWRFIYERAVKKTVLGMKV